MKRSEVLKVIEDHIRLATHFKTDYSATAKRILRELEELGMLPPMLPIPKYKFQAEHKWEPEDEE